jgi:hypothetical protein
LLHVCSWTNQLWALFCLCQTMMRYNTEQHVFLGENYNRRKKSYDTGSIASGFNQQTVCFKVVKSGMKLCPLPISRDINQRVCWHKKLSKTSKQDTKWVQKSHLYPMSQKTSISKASVLGAMKILCDFHLWENLKQKTHTLEAYRL